MARLRRASASSKEKLRKLADEELMERVAGCDADAFEVVLERHADAAFSLAYRICGRRSVDEGIEETLEAPERTEDQAVENAVSSEIRGALGELPPDQRKVIELAYFGGFTHTEIASILDTPVGTVKGRMRLGLQKLRSQLQGWQAVSR